MILNKKIKIMMGVMGFAACIVSTIVAGALIGALFGMHTGKISDVYDDGVGFGTAYLMAAPAESALPEIETLSAEKVNDSTYRLTVNLKSGCAKVTGAGAVFKNENGDTISAGGEYKALTDGKYMDIVIPQYTANGSYGLERLVMSDTYGRTVIYYDSALYSENYSADRITEFTDEQKNITLEVTENRQDTNAPRLRAFEIDGTSAHAGGEVTFAVAAYDPDETVTNAYGREISYSGSGLKAVKVNWVRKSDEGGVSFFDTYSFGTDFLFADLDGSEGVYMGTFKVPSQCVDGRYVIKNITVSDKAGNRNVYVNQKYDRFNSLYTDSDTRNTLGSAIESVYFDIKDETATTVTDGTTAAAAKAALTAGAVQTKIYSEAFALNSQGKLAASLELESEAYDGEEGVDTDALESTAQNIKFSATADRGTIPDGSTFTVNRLVQGNTYSKARKHVENIASKSVLFDVKITDNAGDKIQPDGSVSIITQIPDGFDKNKISVYRLSEDGSSCTELKCTVSGERVLFSTDHFSVFILAEDADGATSTYAPKMADEAPLAALAFVLMSSALTAIIVSRKNGLKRNGD